ncbi:MAG: hypothetical protein GTN93_21515 [Anaerolineae bacterium]|nr:hypothetical protein [Anaerolineae bacterium]
MAEGETQVKPGDPPKIVKKSNALLKWLGGIATVPVLLWVGNFLGGMINDSVAHVEDLTLRVNTLEANNSSKDAIWSAIHKNEGDLAYSVDRNRSMEVKYEAAMLLFEKHFLHGG